LLCSKLDGRSDWMKLQMKTWKYQLLGYIVHFHYSVAQMTAWNWHKIMVMSF